MKFCPKGVYGRLEGVDDLGCSRMRGHCCVCADRKKWEVLCFDLIVDEETETGVR